MKTQEVSKTKSSFYRRLYVAYLIDSGTNTVQGIIDDTGMHRRTLQDTITALSEIDIICSASGGTKNKTYSIEDWGAINKSYIKNNIQHIIDVLHFC